MIFLGLVFDILVLRVSGGEIVLVDNRFCVGGWRGNFTVWMGRG